MIAWVTSIISSSRSVPSARPWRRSRISNSRTSVRGCSATVTLGSVTTKLAGRRPPVSPNRVSRKISSVRALRAFHSSPNDLMRMPTNGGSAPSRMPRATSRAAAIAVASSSASGRAPKPSSKSMRKSSTGSRSSLRRTRSCTVVASQPSGIRAVKPTPRAKSAGVRP